MKSMASRLKRCAVLGPVDKLRNDICICCPRLWQHMFIDKYIMRGNWKFDVGVGLAQSYEEEVRHVLESTDAVPKSLHSHVFGQLWLWLKAVFFSAEKENGWHMFLRSSSTDLLQDIINIVYVEHFQLQAGQLILCAASYTQPLFLLCVQGLCRKRWQRQILELVRCVNKMVEEEPFAVPCL